MSMTLAIQDFTLIVIAIWPIERSFPGDLVVQEIPFIGGAILELHFSFAV
jgi:hypothetical protein